MRFRRPGGGTLEIGAEALTQLMRHRQITPSATEAGGLLLGRILLDEVSFVVDEAVPPAAADTRTRFSFFRKRRPAQEKVDKAWEGSQHTRNYLGEWHSHPEHDPTPSCLDTRNWRRILRGSTYEQGSLFFLIVGMTSLRAWEGRKEGCQLFLLDPID